MDFCENCGKEIPDHLKFCPHCGAYIEKIEGRTFGYGILSFFIPIIGIVLYLVWRKEKPKAAKSAIKGWILNVALKVIALIIVLIFSVFIVGVETGEASYQNYTDHQSGIGINNYDYDYGTYSGENEETDDYSSYATTTNYEITTYNYSDYYGSTDTTEDFDYDYYSSFSDDNYDYNYDDYPFLTSDAYDYAFDNYYPDYYDYEY